MNRIKLFTNVHEVQTFQGFTLQKGFIYGFIDRNPVASNGLVYFKNDRRCLNMYRVNKFDQWESITITNASPLFNHFFKVIQKNALRGNGVVPSPKKSPKGKPNNYATDIQLENMRLRELRENGIEPSPIKARVSKPYDTKYKDCEWRVKQARGKETYVGLGDGLIKMKYQPDIIL